MESAFSPRGQLMLLPCVEGITRLPLAGAVPARPPGSKFTSTTTRATPAALLANCDRRRVGGRRDYAILKLLVRLGLRAGEVAALELGDVDWRRGEVLVRGKG